MNEEFTAVYTINEKGKIRSGSFTYELGRYLAPIEKVIEVE